MLPISTLTSTQTDNVEPSTKFRFASMECRPDDLAQKLPSSRTPFAKSPGMSLAPSTCSPNLKDFTQIFPSHHLDQPLVPLTAFLLATVLLPAMKDFDDKTANAILPVTHQTLAARNHLVKSQNENTERRGSSLLTRLLLQEHLQGLSPKRPRLPTLQCLDPDLSL